jgi:hypothetical protein
MTTDFLQFDPSKNNMVSSLLWLSNTFRLQGGSRGILSSSSFNKLAYQSSTMIAALAQMMEAKGDGTAPVTEQPYDMLDSDVATLRDNLSNIMTRKDMAVYALITQLSGYIAKAAVLIKTTTYGCVADDYYKVIQLQSATSEITITQPAGINGGWIKFKNACTDLDGKLRLGAPVDGATVILDQYEEIVVYYDGSMWRGKKIADSSATALPGLTEPNEKLFIDAAGSGVEWDKGYTVKGFSKNILDVSTTSPTAYTGAGFKPSLVIIVCGIAHDAGLGEGASKFSVGASDALFQGAVSGGAYWAENRDVTQFDVTLSALVDMTYNAGLPGQTGTVSSFDDDGVSLNWTRSGPANGSGNIQGFIIYIR